MASKEKVDIKRSDQFQEVDEELTRAMAELDSTIERVSLIFQGDSGVVDGENPVDDPMGDADKAPQKGEDSAAHKSAEPEKIEQ